MEGKDLQEIHFSPGVTVIWPVHLTSSQFAAVSEISAYIGLTDLRYLYYKTMKLASQYICIFSQAQATTVLKSDILHSSSVDVYDNHNNGPIMYMYVVCMYCM